MDPWSSFLTTLAGLLAVLLLSTSVFLAREQTEKASTGALQILSAAGLTATVLFGGGLLYRLALEALRLLQAWP